MERQRMLKKVTKGMSYPYTRDSVALGMALSPLGGLTPGERMELVGELVEEKEKKTK